MSVAHEVEIARGEIAETARRMLTGDLSFIEGARRISGLCWRAQLDTDPHVVPFMGIDPETDALPIGDVRRHWAPEALAKLQPEIEPMEKWARDFARSHCQNLAKRFKSG